MRIVDKCSEITMGGSVMPIELLVPIIIFSLGVVIAINLSGIGIERIVEGGKK